MHYGLSAAYSSFSVEGRRIRAFRGNIRLGLFKDDITRRMASMLAAFADYAGIGIKTAMGMGAVHLDIAYYQKRSGYESLIYTCGRYGSRQRVS